MYLNLKINLYDYSSFSKELLRYVKNFDMETRRNIEQLYFYFINMNIVNARQLNDKVEVKVTEEVHSKATL